MDIVKFKQHQFIVLTMLLAAGLRSFGLATSIWPLWYDETFTAWLVQLSPARLIAATAGDVHPPLYYLVEWATVQFLGASPWALRLPSVIFSLATVWLAYRLFVILAVPIPVRNMATLAMAVMPVQLYYSHEARMYTLLLALSTWAAIELKQSHFGRFAVAGLLMMYTHNAAVFTLVGLGLWWLLRAHASWRMHVRQWGMVLVFIGLSYAPWAGVILRQTRADWWLREITLGVIIHTLNFLFWFEGTRGFYTLHASVLSLGLLVAGWALLIRDSRADLLVPPIGTLLTNVIVSMLIMPVFLPRSFIGITTWLYLASAWALWKAWQCLPRLVVYAGIAPVLLLGIVGYQVRPINTDHTAELVAAVDLQHDDICYHLNVPSIVIFRYYLPACDHWLLPQVDDPTASPSQQSLTAMGVQQAGLSAIPKKWTRAWLFVNDDPFSNAPSQDIAEKILSQYPSATKILHTGNTSDLIENDLWLVQNNEN